MSKYHRARRYTPGIVVYNSNNYTKGVVLDGSPGKDTDPASRILELAGDGTFFVNTPPNRALIPTGEYFDLTELLDMLGDRKELQEDKEAEQ